MTKNIENENIDAINEYTADLNKVIEIRSKLIEIGQQTPYEDTDIRFFDNKEINISSLGAGRIIDFLIGLSNDRIKELKKNISDSLYPTVCKGG